MRPFANDDRLAHEAEERRAMIRIGTELREFREFRGMTLRQLADDVGLSAPFLSDVEHGRRRMSHVEEIAKALGVKAERFYELAGLCPYCGGSGYAGVKKKEKRR